MRLLSGGSTAQHWPTKQPHGSLLAAASRRPPAAHPGVDVGADAPGAGEEVVFRGEQHLRQSGRASAVSRQLCRYCCLGAAPVLPMHRHNERQRTLSCRQPQAAPAQSPPPQQQPPATCLAAHRRARNVDAIKPPAVARRLCRIKPLRGNVVLENGGVGRKLDGARATKHLGGAGAGAGRRVGRRAADIAGQGRRVPAAQALHFCAACCHPIPPAHLLFGQAGLRGQGEHRAGLHLDAHVCRDHLRGSGRGISSLAAAATASWEER